MAQRKQAALESIAIEDVVEDGVVIEQLYDDMHFVMDDEHDKVASEFAKAQRRIRKATPDEKGKVFKFGEIGEVKVLEKNKSEVKAQKKGKRLEKSIQQVS